MCCYRSRLVLSCCFKDIDISQGYSVADIPEVVVVGSLVIIVCSPDSDTEIGFEIGQ